MSSAARVALATLSALPLFGAAGVSRAAPPPALEVQEVADTGPLPRAVRPSHDGKQLFVVSGGALHAKNVTVYDAVTLATITTIDLPGLIEDALPAPDGLTLYATSFSRDSVLIFDLRLRKLRAEIRLGTSAASVQPKEMALSADGRTLFVSLWAAGAVAQIDARAVTVARTIPTGRHPRGLALAADGTLYVGSHDEATVDVLAPPQRARRSVSACAQPRALVVGPTALWVACGQDREVRALEPGTGRAPSPGPRPELPSGARAFTGRRVAVHRGSRRSARRRARPPRAGGDGDPHRHPRRDRPPDPRAGPRPSERGPRLPGRGRDRDRLGRRPPLPPRAPRLAGPPARGGGAHRGVARAQKIPRNRALKSGRAVFPCERSGPT